MEVSIEDVLDESNHHMSFARWLRGVSNSEYNIESVMKALKMMKNDNKKMIILRWGLRRRACYRLCDDTALMIEIAEIVFELMHRKVVPEWISNEYFNIIHKCMMKI